MARQEYSTVTGLALVVLLIAAPASAYWGATVYDGGESCAVEATISPGVAMPGSTIWIKFYGVPNGGAGYEVLFSSANSAATATATGNALALYTEDALSVYSLDGGYQMYLVVTVPELPAGPAGLEVTDLSSGKLVLSTDEAALQVVAEGSGGYYEYE